MSAHAGGNSSWPEPVLDTSDLAAISQMSEPPTQEIEQPDSPTDRDSRNLWHHWRQYRRWLHQARILAARGVHVAPSHRRYGDVLTPGIWGAFFDADDLRALLAGRNTDFQEHEPLVLLGCTVDPELDRLPTVPDDWDFYAVATQTAGMLCHHRHLIGTPLPLTDHGARIARAIAAFPERDGHRCDHQPLRLSSLAAYQQLLGRWELTAESAYTDLEEGIYPLDRTCARLLTDLRLPGDEDLLGGPQAGELDPGDEDWLGRLGRLMQDHSELDRWRIYIIGQNCD